MFLLTSIFNNSLLTFFGANTTLACNDKPLFFVVPPWWEYMPQKLDSLGQCAPVFHPPGDFWLIGLAILDMLLRLAGFLAVVSIIIAGIEYIVSTGNAEKITNARRRIINALTGLAIALVATAVVSFIGRQFGG